MSEHITIDFDGEQIELVPTLKVAKAISRAAKATGSNSGLFGLAQSAAGGDIEAIAVAIAACTGRPINAVETTVYAIGALNFSGAVSEFYVRLANGGKPIVAQEAEAPAEKNAKAKAETSES